MPPDMKRVILADRHVKLVDCITFNKVVQQQIWGKVVVLV